MGSSSWGSQDTAEQCRMDRSKVRGGMTREQIVNNIHVIGILLRLVCNNILRRYSFVSYHIVGNTRLESGYSPAYPDCSLRYDRLLS